MAKKKRKIIDIDIEEISLVDAAANRKKFYLKKRGTTMDKLKKLLKSILGEDPSEVQIQKLQAQPPAETESLTGALVVLEKYQEDLPEDLAECTVALVKSAISGSASEDAEAFDVDKVGARLSKATKDDLVKIKALVDRMLESDKPGKTEKTEKYDGLPEEIRTRLEALDEQERLEKKAKETALEAENTKLKEAVEGLISRVEKMEKRRVSKQTATDPEDDEDDPVTKKGEPLWPSLAGPIVAPRED